MTPEQFCEEHGIKLEATAVPENPNMSGEMSPGSMHFHCVLRSSESGRTFTTYYSVGSGIVDSWLRAKYPRTKNAPYDFALVRQRRAHQYKPPVSDVLNCLQLDANMQENSRCFHEWCDELGYDSDSIRARKIYDHCEEQARKLWEFLGYRTYRELIDEVQED